MALKNLKSAFIVLLVSLCFFQINAQASSGTTENVEITIDKSTTDSDFESIKSMLSENGIEASFEKVKRNKSEEITGLTINLSDQNGQQSTSSMQSNSPIGNLTFGSKNGSLYIKSGNSQGMASLFGSEGFGQSFDMDSIFGGNGMTFKMEDFFNGNSNLFMFNSDTLDINELKKRFKQNFSFNQNSPNSFSFFNDVDNNDDTSPKYRFVDNPDKETLVVIDGEISDFKTLDSLAKANKLTNVDVLKAETAMSIYGDKAKDGAIIAISKK